MSRTIVSLMAVALMSLRVGALSAQDTPGDYRVNTPPLDDASGDTTPPDDKAPQHGLSRWIVGTDPDCCGPLGDHNPWQQELYLRSGLSFLGGDGIMADSLQNGWLIQGGGRALCFNQGGDFALTFDLGFTNIHNVGVAFPPRVRLLKVPVRQTVLGQQVRVIQEQIDASVNAFNRTFINFGPGFECYLMGAANGTRHGGGPTLRVGVDGGGRWGTAKAEFRDLRHFTDTIGGAYAALHTDYECPIGCCTYFMGIRGEWSYTWSDILQIQNKSDVQDLNLTLQFGVHY